MTITESFGAMNTAVSGGFRTDRMTGKKLFQEVRRRVEDFEARFSRFKADSELSKLNKRAGAPTAVSDEMFDLLTDAQAIWKITDGLIDPTIGQAVIAAGYDASFELLPLADGGFERQKNEFPRATFQDVYIDTKRRAVTLPIGVTLDFGGLGKGYLLDKLAPVIDTATSDYWLSFGGDLLVSGTDDGGRPWHIGIQDPRVLEKDIMQLRPPKGRWGIATSGIMKRRGVRRGTPWHHLIDPRTGQPAVTDVIESTVLAHTALEADAMAKAVLLRGSIEGITWAESLHTIEALVISADNRVLTTEKMKRYIKNR